MELIDLLQRIRSDPSNPIYLLLLGAYSRQDIETALDTLGW